MQKLEHEQQIFVVQLIAVYRTPSQVKALVKEEFQIEISRQSVEYYDPTKNPELSEELQKIFKDTREAYLNPENVGIFHQAYRLDSLQRMAIKAEQSNQTRMAAALLKQAAEETGGIYTNRRELTGKDGAPLENGTSAGEAVQAILNRFSMHFPADPAADPVNEQPSTEEQSV